MSDVFTLHRGTTPLLVSLPHVGTRDPRRRCSRSYVERALAVEDTDWHLDRLYAFARELGAGMLVPRYSRYVIDLNRPPENTPMYPGANNTELCPTRFFTGEPLYRDGRAPDDRRDRARAAQRYWQPYHDALDAELARLKAAHGHAVLCDGHSIKSRAAVAVRRQAARPEPRHRRRHELRAGAARGARCACSSAQRDFTPRHRRPLQGRPHHAPLRPARARHPRGAARDVLVRATWPRQPPFVPRPGARGAPAAGAAGAAAGDAATGRPMR